MTEQLTTYAPAAALVDDEEIVFFMADAFETGDATYIAKALSVVARAKGMTEITQKTGLSREQLYRSLPPSPRGKGFSQDIDNDATGQTRRIKRKTR